MFFFVGNYKNDHDDTRWEFSLVLARGDGRGKAGRRSWCWQKMRRGSIQRLKARLTKNKDSSLTNIEIRHHSIAAQSILLFPSRVLVKRPRYLVRRPEHSAFDFGGIFVALLSSFNRVQHTTYHQYHYLCTIIIYRHLSMVISIFIVIAISIVAMLVIVPWKETCA